MLKIAICEDDKRYIEDLEWCIRGWAANIGINIKIQRFDGGLPLLSCIEKNGMFDLVFMDVEMSGMNGLETAARIREQDYITTIIFVSQYETYYREAYNAHPFHFLTKPINKKKLEETMDAYMVMKKQDVETFTFVVNKARYSIHLKDILYFYSERRHVYAVCKEDKYGFYGKLKDVEKTLEGKTCRFLRIHQSYLVNMRYIKEYHYNELVMYNGEELYISKENRKRMRDIHMLLMED